MSGNDGEEFENVILGIAGGSILAVSVKYLNNLNISFEPWRFSKMKNPV